MTQRLVEIENIHASFTITHLFICDTVVSQGFLIDRAGRKKLMGYGYLSMGLTMCGLTVTLSIKVMHLERGSSPPSAFHTNYQLTMTVYLFTQHLSSWIPYLNIALIFSIICMYGLGPCKFFGLLF